MARGERDPRCGRPEVPEWSAAEALAVMDAHDIATAVVSISTPRVQLRAMAGHDAIAHAKARELNEFAIVAPCCPLASSPSSRPPWTVASGIYEPSSSAP